MLHHSIYTDAARAHRSKIHLATGALAIGLMYTYLQFSTAAICCGDFDGYYHTRWSRLLWEAFWERKFPPAFTWLPLTTLNPQDYVDHHFLFHIFQIPFTWFGDLRTGAKIATVLFATLALLSCYWLIVRYRLSYTMVWLVALLACSNAFLFRMNMTKAPSISIVLMVTGIHLLFQRRYRLLAPLAFLYVWTYSMFVMLCAAALIWAGVIWWSERRLEWRPVVWTAGGVIAGFIINPYFPSNLWLFYEHVMIKARVTEFSTRVGGEWYPWNSWEFLGNCFVAFVAMVVGYIAFDGADKKSAARPLFFLVFSTILLIINARSGRWSEYWPPFAVLFAAFSLQPLFDRARPAEKGARASSPDTLSYFPLHGEAPVFSSISVAPQRSNARYRYTAIAVIVLALGSVMYLNVRRTALDIAGSARPEQYREAMQWMRAHVPSGEIIFNTDWDDFPKLFFYNTDHRYVSGLDPTYLLDHNPQLAQLYQNITLGEEENPALLIRRNFGARYVFTDQKKIGGRFYARAIESGAFEEVYDDSFCTVLRIMDVPVSSSPPTSQNGPDEKE